MSEALTLAAAAVAVWVSGYFLLAALAQHRGRR